MVFAENAATVGESLLEQSDGIVHATNRFICSREIVARGQSIGVVFAEDAGAVGERLFV